MDYELLFPGRFLKAVEMRGREVTLTITEVHVEKHDDTDDAGNVSQKPIRPVHFQETDKELALNRTNAQCLAAMFGRDTDGWLGKRVTLYPAPYKWRGGDVAIRVKGSPDIAAPVTCTVQLPRKKPVTYRLVPTGRGRDVPPDDGGAS